MLLSESCTTRWLHQHVGHSNSSKLSYSCSSSRRWSQAYHVLEMTPMLTNNTSLTFWKVCWKLASPPIFLDQSRDTWSLYQDLDENYVYRFIIKQFINLVYLRFFYLTFARGLCFQYQSNRNTKYLNTYRCSFFSNRAHNNASVRNCRTQAVGLKRNIYNTRTNKDCFLRFIQLLNI